MFLKMKSRVLRMLVCAAAGALCLYSGAACAATLYKAHGQPFHNDADGLAVRSAEDRDAKVFSQTAHGVSSLFKALKSSPKRG